MHIVRAASCLLQVGNEGASPIKFTGSSQSRDESGSQPYVVSISSFVGITLLTLQSHPMLL
jgi:hypothetical protein